MIKHSPCAPDDWWKLPLALRQRWWEETEYGLKAPSVELVKAIQAALAEATK
jgi:hypothetical protein